MAMMGLPKSPLRIPVARHNEREAAALSPLVVVSDLNGFINRSRFLKLQTGEKGKISAMWNRNTH